MSHILRENVIYEKEAVALVAALGDFNNDDALLTQIPRAGKSCFRSFTFPSFHAPNTDSSVSEG
jgi:hypothetical protein